MLHRRYKISFVRFFGAIAVLLFSLCIAHTTFAATLSFSPSSSNVLIGDIVSVKVLVNTNNAAINDSGGTIEFPSDLLQVMSVNENSSVFSLWVEQPKFSNSAGTISWNGGLPNPGFTGTSGEVMSVTFLAKKSGNASIIFSNPAVLANDGLGTDVLSSTFSAQIKISTPVLVTPVTDERAVVVAGAPKAPVVTSATNPNQDKWYSDSNPSFSWTVPSDVTAVRLQYDHNQVSVPSVIYSPAIAEKTLKNLSDGTYYFHAQFKNANGWGAIVHFKFNIDTISPAHFQITLAHPDNNTDPRPILYFNTTDSGSGMDHYDVKVGDNSFLTVLAETVASNPYTPPTQDPGVKTVVVNAYDKAGNETTASADINIQPINPPVIDSYQNEMQEGDFLRIQGHSYPNATVNIVVKDSNGVESSDTTPTNTVGKFTILWSHALSSGVYTFRATVTNDKGATSLSSDSYTVAVNEKALYQIGSVVINFLSIIFLVIIVLAALIAVIMYSYHKLNQLRHKIRQTASGAEFLMHRRFDQLEKDVDDHLVMLEKVKSRRALTKEEKVIFDTLKKYLETTEKDVDVKLEQLKKDAE